MNDDLFNLENSPLGTPSPLGDPVIDAAASEQQMPSGSVALDSPQTSAQPTAAGEFRDRSTEGAFGHTLGKRFKITEYDIMLGVAALALFLGCLFLFLELWSYD